VYEDSEWLETNSPLPTWYDYRQRIKKGLNDSLEWRRRLNGIYAERLPAELQLAEPYQTWRFNIRPRHQARILQAIFSAGLFASAHYTSLAGIMADGRAAAAETLASEIINLFNDQHFTLQMAERVCAVIRENLD
jgi:hypothetical protein